MTAALAFSGEVHPAAELFPLVAQDELEALAVDIKANGLRQPIVLDAEGRLVDGRSRLAACKLAKVKPMFVTLNGEDTLDFVVSMNVRRRNLTPAQLAIAAREAWPLYEVGQGKRTSGSSAPKLRTREMLAALFGVGEKTVQQARALPEDLASEVKNGGRSLADAYAEHQRRADEEKRTETLPEDLATRVRDQALPLVQAEEIEAERSERVAAWVSKIREALSVLSRMVGAPIPAEFEEALTEHERKALTLVLGVIPKGVGE